MIQKRLTFALVACVAAVVSAWAVAGISVAAQAGAADRPDLSGQWQLNRDLSEDAQAKFASMGGGGGHHGGGQPGAQGQGMEEIRDRLLNAPTRLVVAQDDQKVVLTDADGHVRTLPTNNRKVQIRWARRPDKVAEQPPHIRDHNRGCEARRELRAVA